MIKNILSDEERIEFIEIVSNIENKNYIKNSLKKENINIFNKLEIFYEENKNEFLNRNELYYLLYDNMEEKPICQVCKEHHCKFNGFNKGYSKYCSTNCSNKRNISKEVKNKPKNPKNTGKKYTKEMYQNKLNEKYGENVYILLDDYVPGGKVLTFLHTECGRTFKKRTDLLLNQHGCPLCAKEKKKEPKNKLTNEEFIKRCEINNNGKFTPLEEYKDSDSPIKLKCNICNKTFIRGRANDVINNKLGCPRCGAGTSNEEKELFDYIENLNPNVVHNDRNLIKPYELDIVDYDNKIAIEYDGLYWHSELNGKDNKYHLNKTKLCNEKGFRLIHIFQDEWVFNKKLVKKKLKHILNKNNSEKIYARKCIVKEIYDPKIKNDFLNKNHIQGEDKSNIKLGLYYNEELVALMTFGSLRKALGRKSKENCYELVRYATDTDKIVIGGFP